MIVAGTEDGIVDYEAQSVRSHGILPNSSLRLVPGAGHTIQQTATEAMMAAIEEASDLHLRSTAGADAKV